MLSTFNIILLIIVSAVILAAVATCVILLSAYKKYLNRRLKNEGKIRRFPQPLTLILTMALTVSLICNIACVINIAVIVKNNDAAYGELLSQMNPNAVIIEDFNQNPEYADYRDGLLSGNLAGYEISKETDGDFECYLAVPKGKIGNSFFMPQYFIYVAYTGEALENVHRERTYSYDEDGHGWGARGGGIRDTLLIGNTLSEPYYIGIKTVLKIAPLTTETKENWDALPIHSEAHFVIQNGSFK